MLTDNEVLLRRHKVLPTLVCEQKSATKAIPTEEMVVESNIATFGNEVGKITNRATSMYEVRSHFSEDSEEYQMLSYRIRCSQAQQQESIEVGAAAQ